MFIVEQMYVLFNYYRYSMFTTTPVTKEWDREDLQTYIRIVYMYVVCLLVDYGRRKQTVYICISTYMS